MFVCKYCKTTYSNLNGLDYSEEGFFCDDCDCFTYFENIKKQHQFQLFLEDKGPKTDTRPCKIKLNKRLSPLRYPGGKSKMLPLLYQSINKENSQIFVEPFAGGAGVGLGLLASNIIGQYVLNDIDYGIFSLFATIKSTPEVLINKLQTTTPTHKDFFAAKQIILTGYAGCNQFDAAWALLLVNRLSYSGIAKAGPLGGKNGTETQLLSRWNPTEIIQKIRKIYKLSGRIVVTNQDALSVIENYYWEPHATIFIDPPYFKKGKQLYTHYFQTVNHIELSNLLFSLSTGCPGADILLTYDNEPTIQELYWWAPTQNIKLHYSI